MITDLVIEADQLKKIMEPYAPNCEADDHYAILERLNQHVDDLNYHLQFSRQVNAKWKKEYNDLHDKFELRGKEIQSLHRRIEELKRGYGEGKPTKKRRPKCATDIEDESTEVIDLASDCRTVIDLSQEDSMQTHGEPIKETWTVTEDEHESTTQQETPPETMQCYLPGDSTYLNHQTTDGTETDGKPGGPAEKKQRTTEHEDA